MNSNAPDATNNGATDNGTGSWATGTGQAGEIYEQMLALADRVGAAYVNAYQKIALGMGDLQQQWSAGGGRPGSRQGPSKAGGVAGATPFGLPAEYGHELNDKLLDLTSRIGLAYLDAYEQAVQAVADCQEELASATDHDFLRTVIGARAELMREITQAYATAARDIVG
jgi:hypothetical protein